MSEILHKIDVSFRAATKGQEDIQTVIRWWGIFSYFIFYFVIDTIILKVNYRFLDLMLAWVAAIYFIWHIYALIKCKPKQPKLSKEEKQKIRQEKLLNVPRSFMRKLFLQESVSKWNPVSMCIAADLLLFTNFLSYILN